MFTCSFDDVIKGKHAEKPRSKELVERYGNKYSNVKGNIMIHECLRDQVLESMTLQWLGTSKVQSVILLNSK
jgi:hypothetical protein